MNALLCADCPLPLPLKAFENNFQDTWKNPVPDTLSHSFFYDLLRIYSQKPIENVW